MFEGCCGIRQVFQHIQHENQIESLAGLKASIKRLSEDLIAPGTVGSQRCFVRFNTEDAAEPGQAGEQQSVAAANIQNSGRAIFSESKATDLTQYGPLPRPPPPVLLIQFPILLCVIALHEAVCPSTA